MYPVPWCDALEIIPATGSETLLTVTGTKVEGEITDNLCFRAWQLMADAYNITPVTMHLHKVIPSRAGLGGGSSDASFALRMMNDLFKLSLTADILRSMAIQLGSDCPYFIENNPLLLTGRGEHLKPVNVSLDGLHILIVKPPVHVSTAAAFTGITPLERENSIEEYTSLPVTEWKRMLNNDFEPIVFELYPEIQDIKYWMYRHGAVYASLSGSGSAVYGLFDKKPVTTDFPGCDVFETLLGRHP
jgi:4-diphosphocytidyl-2-C-methyl-D-erythritol kinase